MFCRSCKTKVTHVFAQILSLLIDMFCSNFPLDYIYRLGLECVRVCYIDMTWSTFFLSRFLFETAFYSYLNDSQLVYNFDLRGVILKRQVIAKNKTDDFFLKIHMHTFLAIYFLHTSTR